MRYKKKPVEVDAFRLTTDAEMIAPEWFTQAIIDEKISIDQSILDGHVHIYGCTIYSPKGRQKAKIGDYIIREQNGEMYSCKAQDFQKTYDKVT